MKHLFIEVKPEYENFGAEENIICFSQETMDNMGVTFEQMIDTATRLMTVRSIWYEDL